MQPQLFLVQGTRIHTNGTQIFADVYRLVESVTETEARLKFALHFESEGFTVADVQVHAVIR